MAEWDSSAEWYTAMVGELLRKAVDHINNVMGANTLTYDKIRPIQTEPGANLPELPYLDYGVFSEWVHAGVNWNPPHPYKFEDIRGDLILSGTTTGGDDSGKLLIDESIDFIHYQQILYYSNLTGTFQANERVWGQTSLATGNIQEDDGVSQMLVASILRDFQDGETVKGEDSGATATVNASVSVISLSQWVENTTTGEHSYIDYILGKHTLRIQEPIFEGSNEGYAIYHTDVKQRFPIPGLMGLALGIHADNARDATALAWGLRDYFLTLYADDTLVGLYRDRVAQDKPVFVARVKEVGPVEVTDTVIERGGVERRRDLTITLLTDEWLERIDKNIEKVTIQWPRDVTPPPWERIIVEEPGDKITLTDQ